MRWVKRLTKRVSTPSVAQAKARPTTPATIDSSVLSASSWRTSRPRPAPSAARMANSRSRRSIRASVRLATLAQASSSTRPVVPSSSHRIGRAFTVSAASTGAVRAWKPVSAR